MGISVLRQCLNEECRAPFRPEDNSFMGHVCVLCREAMRLENFARCVLREKKAEPPERWV